MPERFVDAMRLLAGAVTIVSAGDEAAASGLTATAVCSLSANPPRMLVCLNRAGSTFKALLDSGCFCVNILAVDQKDLSLEFSGQTGKVGEEKFSDALWDHSGNVAPRRCDALAAVQCRTHMVTLVGTHAIVVGDVVETHFGDRRDSLIYRDGAFL